MFNGFPSIKELSLSLIKNIKELIYILYIYIYIYLGNRSAENCKKNKTPTIHLVSIAVDILIALIYIYIKSYRSKTLIAILVLKNIVPTAIETAIHFDQSVS